MKIQLSHKFEDIISVDNLLEAWKEFARGKRHKRDVCEFSLRLMDNILLLHDDLINHTYKHGPYQAFNVCDPKPRNIHKATVRDRLLHHALYRVLYPFFSKAFIADSYSCQLGKGTHKALNRFRKFSYIVSKNNTRTCWILKCDIKKFFASIDQKILLGILKQYIPDQNIIWLLEQVIKSFESGLPACAGDSSAFGLRMTDGCTDCKNGVKGLPLGNLTSQLLVNIYMNEFDQFVKHTLKAKYYIRYADDFVVFSEDCGWLEWLISAIDNFLSDNLKLKLHPDKLFIKTLSSGVDFLGWVNFGDHRILRTATKRRMFRRIEESPVSATFNSYLGLLKHGNACCLKSEIMDKFYVD